MSSISDDDDDTSEDKPSRSHSKYISPSSDDDEEELDAPQTAFATLLREAMEQDREPADDDSKYTAFWVDLDLPLSSQYRQGLTQAL